MRLGFSAQEANGSDDDNNDIKRDAGLEDNKGVSSLTKSDCMHYLLAVVSISAIISESSSHDRKQESRQQHNEMEPGQG